MATTEHWINRMNEIRFAVSQLPTGYAVDAYTIQEIFGVSLRMAQIILKPIITEQIGRRGITTPAALSRRLKEMVGSIDLGPDIERNRRTKLAGWILKQEADIRATPRLLVEAPVTITGSQLDSVPGLELAPGAILLRFQSPEEARIRLLALAMAIARDQDGFDSRVALLPPGVQDLWDNLNAEEKPKPTPPKSSDSDAAA